MSVVTAEPWSYQISEDLMLIGNARIRASVYHNEKYFHATALMRWFCWKKLSAA